MGHIAKELENDGYDVRKTDIVDYGYEGCLFGEQYDFLKLKNMFDGDIITNPPYGLATEFAEHAMDIITDGHKVAMFLKIQFLETQKRYVTDIELKKLCEVLNTTFEELTKEK